MKWSYFFFWISLQTKWSSLRMEPGWRTPSLTRGLRVTPSIPWIKAVPSDNKTLILSLDGSCWAVNSFNSVTWRTGFICSWFFTLSFLIISITPAVRISPIEFDWTHNRKTRKGANFVNWGEGWKIWIKIRWRRSPREWKRCQLYAPFDWERGKPKRFVIAYLKIPVQASLGPLSYGKGPFTGK